MDVDFLYRTIPFASLAFLLLGWALIELLQTRREDWDWLTFAIVFPGIAGFLYLGSLALNYSPIDPDWKDGYFETIRIVLLLTVPCVPVVYVNVARAWRARRKGQFRKKIVYDVHDTTRETGRDGFA